MSHLQSQWEQLILSEMLDLENMVDWMKQTDTMLCIMIAVTSFITIWIEVQNGPSPAFKEYEDSTESEDSHSTEDGSNHRSDSSDSSELEEDEGEEEEEEDRKSSTGQLNLIVGPMYAGKSTELLRHIRAHQFLNRKMVVINHAWNMRYNTKGVSTHTGDVYTNCLHATLLQECESNPLFKESEYVFIEELQFFTDAVVVLKRWVNSLGKRVYAAALSGDYRREGFDTITPLYSIADNIHHICAYCTYCGDGTLAPFTFKMMRVDTDTDTAVATPTSTLWSGTKSVVEVGGKEKYVALCRYHYFQQSASACSRARQREGNVALNDEEDAEDANKDADEECKRSDCERSDCERSDCAHSRVVFISFGFVFVLCLCLFCVCYCFVYF